MHHQYDRSLLRDVAASRGDETAADMARRLRIARMTAWRLWTGASTPTARLAATVEAHYGITAAQLCMAHR